MSSEYQDFYGRWHDKPKGSNNGWIYTAYSKYLAPKTYNQEVLKSCFKKCARSYEPMKIDRSPRDNTPPMSKDEIIGMLSLDMLGTVTLKKSHWNFCNLDEYKQKKIGLQEIIDVLKVSPGVLLEMKKLEGGNKRNYYWKNKVVELYPFAFRLSWANRHYAHKQYGTKSNPVYFLAFYFQVLSDIVIGNKSVKMMNWLKLKDIGSPIAKMLPIKRYVKNYFGTEHPFYKGLK